MFFSILLVKFIGNAFAELQQLVSDLAIAGESLQFCTGIPQLRRIFKRNVTNSLSNGRRENRTNILIRAKRNNQIIGIQRQAVNIPAGPHGIQAQLLQNESGFGIDIASGRGSGGIDDPTRSEMLHQCLSNPTAATVMRTAK